MTEPAVQDHADASLPPGQPPRPATTPMRPARLALSLLAIALAGCQATTPTLGGGGTVATGAAGGATAAGASSQLETCTESLGTIAVDEDQRAPWFYDLQRYKLGPTTPVLRTMIQQSNCFVVVERGNAMNNVMRERALDRSGETRAGSNMGPGQMVAADYTLSPTVNFSAKGTEGLRLGGGGLIGSVIGAAAGSIKANEASTTLLMVDNRSGVQLAAAQGSASNWDIGGAIGLLGGSLGAAGGGYTNTPEGRIIVAAFMDSYNQLVKAVRNYRAQSVKGGLGTGGGLGVQGGTTPASQALQPAPAPAPAAAPAAAPATKPPATKPPATRPPTTTTRPPAQGTAPR
jgi:curli biogenesis system outer membrane secretion channel CsgG